MYMHDGTSSFLKMLTGSVVAVGFVAWLHIYFSPSIALIAVALVAGTIFFVGGSMLSSHIQKNTIENVVKFAAADATTDRYRMESFKETVKAHASTTKAQNDIYVLDAKRQYKMLEAQDKDAYEEQKQIAAKARQGDAWGWDDDEDEAFAGWE